MEKAWWKGLGEGPGKGLGRGLATSLSCTNLTAMPVDLPPPPRHYILTTIIDMIANATARPPSLVCCNCDNIAADMLH